MPYIRRSGLTGNLVFAIAAGALGSSFQHGYNIGVVNAPKHLVVEFINETYHERFGEYADVNTADFIFSIIVSVFCVGGMLGALMTAFVAERYGRKGGLLLNNVMVFMAAALMGFCKMCHSYEMMVVGRFLIGVNAGLNAGLAPMYLAEISPNHLRGAIGTIYQLVITISILVSNILGLPSIMGTHEQWPILFALIVVPAVFMLITLPLCPESPKHILIIQGRDVNAQRALTWFRGTIEVHDEMDEMRAEYEAMKLVPKVTLHEIWYNPALRQPMVIAVVVMLSQQLSGINAVIFFSSTIFEDAGLSPEGALNATMALGVINVMMTLVSLVLIEKSGRRTLHLFGLIGMSFTTLILVPCIEFKSVKLLQYVSMFSVFAFVIMFASGPGSIPWFLVGELFGAGARAIATSIAVAVNWSANFVVGIGFLPLKNMMEGYVFLVFTFLLIIFSLFTYHKVPETKGKSSEEIAALFRQKAYQIN